jgi:hypothetical protein
MSALSLLQQGVRLTRSDWGPQAYIFLAEDGEIRLWTGSPLEGELEDRNWIEYTED